VAAQVVARQSSSTPDQLLMAAVSVTCSPTTGGVVNATLELTSVVPR
jgi:hypothetical protein